MNDYGRPVRDEARAWQDSVDREWERRERLERNWDKWPVDEGDSPEEKDDE
jgi:hypothetical protein